MHDRLHMRSLKMCKPDLWMARGTGSVALDLRRDLEVARAGGDRRHRERTRSGPCPSVEA